MFNRKKRENKNKNTYSKENFEKIFCPIENTEIAQLTVGNLVYYEGGSVYIGMLNLVLSLLLSLIPPLLLALTL